MDLSGNGSEGDMHLTWKDGLATLLAAAVVLVAVAVVQGWGWPLLGSYRAGSVAILILGMGMCATGNSATQDGSVKDPYVAITTVLGIVTLGIAIWAIVADTETSMIALTASTITLWAISTIAHAAGFPHAVAGSR
jgi:cytochrome bd-type quinol oxidase subunit 2